MKLKTEEIITHFTCLGSCFLHDVVVITGGGRFTEGGSYLGTFFCARFFGFFAGPVVVRLSELIN